MEFDSDDECGGTGLPDMKSLQNPNGVEFKVDLRALENGEGQEFSFEMPDVVETEGHKKSGPPRSDKITKRVNLEHMKYPLVSEEDKEILSVMFGDFSEIEPLMTNILEDGSIKKRLIRPGTGNKVMPNDVVGVHYLIGVEFMDDLIESTYENKRPRRYRMNSGELLPVMEDGILTMRVGEIAKFLGTSEHGYGKLGVPLLEENTIPPEARVMVQIEVVEAYQREKHESIARLSSTERAELPFSKLYKYAEEMKTEGNREMKDGDYEQATKYYKYALDAIKDMLYMNQEQLEKYAKIRNAVCNNLAQAYFKRGKFTHACKYAENGTTIHCNGLLKAKSHYWFAKALFELGRYQLSYVQIQVAEELRPGDDGDIKKFKTQVEEKLKITKQKEKDLCTRMMEATISKKGKK